MRMADVFDHLNLDGDDDDAAVAGGGVGSGSVLFFSKALDQVFFYEKEWKVERKDEISVLDMRISK